MRSSACFLRTWLPLFFDGWGNLDFAEIHYYVETDTLAAQCLRLLRPVLPDGWKLRRRFLPHGWFTAMYPREPVSHLRSQQLPGENRW